MWRSKFTISKYASLITFTGRRLCFTIVVKMPWRFKSKHQRRQRTFLNSIPSWDIFKGTQNSKFGLSLMQKGNYLPYVNAFLRTLWLMCHLNWLVQIRRCQCLLILWLRWQWPLFRLLQQDWILENYLKDRGQREQ